MPAAKPRGQVPDTPDSRGKALQAQRVAQQAGGAAAQPRRLSLPCDSGEVRSPTEAHLAAALPPGSAIPNTVAQSRLPPPPFDVEQAAEPAGRQLRFSESCRHRCPACMQSTRPALAHVCKQQQVLGHEPGTAAQWSTQPASGLLPCLAGAPPALPGAILFSQLDLELGSADASPADRAAGAGADAAPAGDGPAAGPTWMVAATKTARNLPRRSAPGTTATARQEGAEALAAAVANAEPAGAGEAELPEALEPGCIAASPQQAASRREQQQQQQQEPGGDAAQPTELAGPAAAVAEPAAPTAAAAGGEQLETAQGAAAAAADAAAATGRARSSSRGRKAAAAGKAAAPEAPAAEPSPRATRSCSRARQADSSGGAAAAAAEACTGRTRSRSRGGKAVPADDAEAALPASRNEERSRSRGRRGAAAAGAATPSARAAAQGGRSKSRSRVKPDAEAATPAGQGLARSTAGAARTSVEQQENGDAVGGPATGSRRSGRRMSAAAALMPRSVQPPAAAEAEAGTGAADLAPSSRSGKRRLQHASAAVADADAKPSAEPVPSNKTASRRGPAPSSPPQQPNPMGNGAAAAGEPDAADNARRSTRRSKRPDTADAGLAVANAPGLARRGSEQLAELSPEVATAGGAKRKGTQQEEREEGQLACADGLPPVDAAQLARIVQALGCGRCRNSRAGCLTCRPKIAALLVRHTGRWKARHRRLLAVALLSVLTARRCGCMKLATGALCSLARSAPVPQEAQGLQQLMAGVGACGEGALNQTCVCLACRAPRVVSECVTAVLAAPAAAPPTSACSPPCR